MFSQSTELYDFIYSEFKDFEAEASQVSTLLREKCPSAKRLLDVGCGTGRHAAALVSNYGFEVDGLDIEAGFLEIARERCPNGEFFRGGAVHMTIVDREDLKISRVNRTEIRGRISWMEFQYLVADPDEIRHLKEVHELGLFTEEEMFEALRAGGFQEVEFDPEGITGRGLYIARSQS